MLTGEEWQQVAKWLLGPLFRSIRKGGRIGALKRRYGLSSGLSLYNLVAYENL